MIYKYIISQSTNPYENLAIEQSLFRIADKETIVLFLWQNDNTIVIGRNQDLFTECKVAEFLAEGGTIARRCSGGGAVYHDLGNLNYSIIGLLENSSLVDYKQLVMEALKSLGVSAVFNGRNDLVVDNRKFSGNASYNNGKVLCQHGTIMINVCVERMSQFLTPDKSKLSHNHVKSITSRVVNLSILFPEITVDKVRLAMINAVQAIPIEEKTYEKEIQKGVSFFSNKEWIFGGLL